MKENIQKIPVVLWLAVMAGSRILYLFLGTLLAADPYGYYGQAMIRAGEKAQTAADGFSRIYVKFLSGLFLFTGNRPEAVAACQLILQIIWLLLFYLGMRLLLGKWAGLILAAALSFLPVVWESAFRISPENLAALGISVLLILPGLLVKAIRRHGRKSDMSGEEQTDMEQNEEWVSLNAENAPKEPAAQAEALEKEPVAEKKVQLFDNPLPVPKKHVKKEMEFDIDAGTDDFDVKIADNDDFDIR